MSLPRIRMRTMNVRLDSAPALRSCSTNVERSWWTLRRFPRRCGPSPGSGAPVKCRVRTGAVASPRLQKSSRKRWMPSREIVVRQLILSNLLLRMQTHCRNCCASLTGSRESPECLYWPVNVSSSRRLPSPAVVPTTRVRTSTFSTASSLTISRLSREDCSMEAARGHCLSI